MTCEGFIKLFKGGENTNVHHPEQNENPIRNMNDIFAHSHMSFCAPSQNVLPLWQNNWPHLHTVCHTKALKIKHPILTHFKLY